MEGVTVSALPAILDWIDGVLSKTDPDDQGSYFNDSARECCESIAFDERRPAVIAAITELRAALAKGENQ